MMDIITDLLNWFITVLIKKSSGDAVTHANKSAIKNEIMSNEKLAEELHRPITRKFGKRKVHSSFKDNI